MQDFDRERSPRAARLGGLAAESRLIRLERSSS